MSCHSAPNGPPWAGGYAIETRFGTFYGPNLTPSSDGLAGWTAEDLRRALRDGRSPEGHAYWPAFPYASYTHLTDADIGDLWAFLATLPPALQADHPHARKGVATLPGAVAAWRLVGFHDRGPLPSPSDAGALWTRGQYLVEAVAHCGECHSPRSAVGAVQSRRALAGNDQPPAPAPNITPGALPWDAGDWTHFLASGMTPDGDVTGGEMYRVIRDGTSRLSEDDRAAMATYLRSVRPRGEPAASDEEEEEEAW